ncbi:hypothetical protein M9H77_36365 [Catharanthus roseus]|uniref:Uncharacterized protein n=1 Tax=Catharanthus roseus TaxID=4058 RepID=A0ACB9ZRZ6_CATRO|nr:hypothetical protein M9H77_36365 [Catharanthus roseus]
MASSSTMSSNVPSFNANSTPAMRTSKRSKYSKFIQQEVPACNPILTPIWFPISTFWLVNVVFIPVGVVAILLASRDYVPENFRKENIAFIRTCIRTLSVSSLYNQIYVYYQLNYFYQNHRSSVGRNDNQLRDPISENDVSACAPEDFLAIASMLVGISWNCDRDHRFGEDLSKQEDLIVWMRTTTLLRLKKLYDKIEVDLEVGDVTSVTLENNYNTDSFNSIKKLVHSTTNLLGGKHDFLSFPYVTVGGLCFFFAIFFTYAYIVIMPSAEVWRSRLSWRVAAGGWVRAVRRREEKIQGATTV